MEQTKQKSRKGYYFGIGIFVLVFIIYTAGFVWRLRTKAPYFMVMINPVHGGKSAVASKTDGDLYDPINKQYVLNYKEGNIANGISEYKILLNLSKMIKKRLAYTKEIGGWKNFEKILLKYGQHKDYKKIVIDAELTKEYDFQDYLNKGEKDVNKHFRLFDYPSKIRIKKWNKGILSLINKYKPEIVLNIDFNYSGHNDDELFSISVPNFQFFNYIKGKLINKDLNFNEYLSIVNNWYGKNKKGKIRNLINDTWIYFTGTYPDSTFFAPSDKFMGIPYNSIKWNYQDKDYPESYENKEKYPQYCRNLKDFRPEGDFWERENYKSERNKRLDGNYGVGDTEYIGEEILKYIISVLNLNKDKRDVNKLKKITHVYKYDAISLYVNSLVININLGSIYDGHIQNIYKNKIEDIADAICIGFYSICQGYDIKKADIKPDLLPEGKPVDFKKYYKYNYIGRKRKSYY